VCGVICTAQATSPDDAKAFAEKAAAFAKAQGKDKAVAEFNNPKGQFVKGELYIFMNDFSGICLAHGGTPQLVGKNLLGLKDANDKYFFKEMTELAKTKGSGWVDYSWTNPTTKKVQPKTTWIQRVEGQDYYVGCGVYK
jgi:cytochrome c